MEGCSFERLEADDCFLCENSLVNAESKKRKLKLCGKGRLAAGHAAVSELEFLFSVTIDQLRPNMDIQTAYLCYQCNTKLVKHAKLRESIRKVELEITETYQRTLQLNRRRRLSQAENEQPPSKQQAVQHQACVIPSPVRTNTVSVVQSPNAQIIIDYKSGPKCYPVNTPWRKKCVKKLARHSDKSFNSAVVNASSKEIICQLSKQIQQELKFLSSMEHNSILRDGHEAVKCFSWETVWKEFEQATPTLLELFKSLLPPKKPLICMFLSMIVKQRSPNLCLVQRAISIMLYGNAAHKQVYECLQPLMVSLSYCGMRKLVETLSQSYDAAVLTWSDLLERNMKEHTEELLNVDFGNISESDEETDESLVSPTVEHDADNYNDMDTEFDGLFDEDLLNDFELVTDNSDHTNNETKPHMVSTNESTDVSEAAVELTVEPASNSHERIGFNSKWNGFKLVLDNVDRSINPSFHRLNRESKLLHFVQVYAVLDRVDFSGLSDSISFLSEIDPLSLLPSDDDIKKLKSYCTTIITRILVTRMHQFQKQDIQWHIPSQHTEEMSSRSTVVPLGVMPYNENKIDEMVLVLDKLSQYVPACDTTNTFKLSNGEEYVVDGVVYHKLLLGGDQLTAVRARAAIRASSNNDKPRDRLEGFIPIIEDWHAKQVLLQVMWIRHYSMKSAAEAPTLRGIKNLLNRTCIPNDPKKDIKATEDFLELVIHCHVVAAASTVIANEGKTDLMDISNSIVKSYLRFNFQVSHIATAVDGIMLYACDLLTTGLFWCVFVDAIREGDGEKVILCWKFLLIIFVCSKRKNYSKEAVILLLQQHIMSPRQAAQLQWCRFINTQGRQGCNKPADLHMEHLNRRLKIVMRNLQGNIQPSTISKAGKAIGIVKHICEIFEQESGLPRQSGNHRAPSSAKDFSNILAVLKEWEVFTIKEGRKHSSYQHHCSLFEHFNEERFLAWVGPIMKSCGVSVNLHVED